MRVMIFGDMEGVACIEVWEQVTGGSPMYGESRVLFTEEMNAAVRGARRAGATEVIAVDCHGAGGAQAGGKLRFLLEALQEGSVAGVLGVQGLDGNRPAELGIDGTIDGGHATFAGRPDDAVAIA
jgi:D-amino peptidase